jgi:hypothetical protein
MVKAKDRKVSISVDVIPGLNVNYQADAPVFGIDEATGQPGAFFPIPETSRPYLANRLQEFQEVVRRRAAAMGGRDGNGKA